MNMREEYVYAESEANKRFNRLLAIIGTIIVVVGILVYVTMERKTYDIKMAENAVVYTVNEDLKTVIVQRKANR